MPIVATKSRGLRRYAAQPDRYAERYGNFTFTARDFEILDLIYRYRYLEARHVRALIHGSGQQVTRRLQGLFHNQYIRRYVPRLRMRPDLDPGATLMAYGLERRGARALQAHRARLAVERAGEPELVRWRKDYTRRTEWFLEHQLMISNFRCVLELALRGTPAVELIHWDQGQDTWLRVPIPGERTRFVRVAPDARFSLREAGQIRNFYLETDRSTEEHSQLLRKFVGYWWYLQSSAYQQAHPHPRRVNVLFVTTGYQRMLNMMETLTELQKPNRADHGGKGLFWFCRDKDYLIDDPPRILGPVWRTATKTDRRVSLLG
jgi:hypothetical protein